MINEANCIPPISEICKYRGRIVRQISDIEPLGPFRYAEKINVRWFRVEYYDNEDGTNQLWDVMEYNYNSMIQLSMREKSSRGLSTYSCNKRGLSTGREYV